MSELLEPQVSFPKESWIEYARKLKATNAKLELRVDRLMARLRYYGQQITRDYEWEKGR